MIFSPQTRPLLSYVFSFSQNRAGKEIQRNVGGWHVCPAFSNVIFMCLQMKSSSASCHTSSHIFRAKRGSYGPRPGADGQSLAAHPVPSHPWPGAGHWWAQGQPQPRALGTSLGMGTRPWHAQTATASVVNDCKSIHPAEWESDPVIYNCRNVALKVAMDKYRSPGNYCG